MNYQIINYTKIKHLKNDVFIAEVKIIGDVFVDNEVAFGLTQ